jgi:hypothetical protein
VLHDYTKRNDYTKGDDKKKYQFKDKKKKFKKMIPRACVALSDLDFSSNDFSSSDEDEKPKRKTVDFTGLCLMCKSSRHIIDSDSDVSDDLSPKGLSLRVTELKNALRNQDKLLCKVFHENKKLNIELEIVFSKVASLRSTHDDMSDKPCENCTIIMVSYADLWFMHCHVACLLDGARLELRELKPHFLLLGACTSCPLLRSDLESATVEIKNFNYKFDHSSRYIVLTPLCELYDSLKDKLFYSTKENTKL